MEAHNKEQASIPTLQLPASTTTANLHATNESITSIEDEISSRSLQERIHDIQYSVEGDNLIIQTQVTDPQLYNYILNQQRQNEQNMDVPVRKTSSRKIKEQVHVQHKVPSISKSKDEEGDDEAENKERKIHSQEEISKSEELEYAVPVPISTKTHKRLEIDVPVQEENAGLENCNASSIGSNKAVEPSPQDEEVRFVFPATPPQKQTEELLSLRMRVEEAQSETQGIKIKLDQQAETEKKTTEENKRLNKELEGLKRLLQQSNNEKIEALDKLNKLQNVKKANEGTETEGKLEKSEFCQTESTTIPTSTKSVQTEGLDQSGAMQKMKASMAVLEAKLRVSDKEKLELATSIERQHSLLTKTETELTATTKDNKTLSTELEFVKQGLEAQRKFANNLKSEVNNHKAKILRLEAENKELQRARKESAADSRAPAITELKDRLNRYEQISAELAKENELSKAVISETKEQLQKANAKIDEKKHGNKKQREKVKELKKERDLLKIEILKLKQMYAEKCDGYKEARNRLQKKLKEKEEVISNLQGAMGEKQYVQRIEPQYISHHRNDDDADEYMRAKSLENTSKYNFKNLSSTLQPGEIRKKLADIADDNQYGVEVQMSPINPTKSNTKKLGTEGIKNEVRKDEINDFLETHKVLCISVIR